MSKPGIDAEARASRPTAVAVAPRQLVEGRDQERARAAGRIDDGEIAQGGENGPARTRPLALGLRRRDRPAMASRMPCCGPERGAALVERQRAIVRSTRKRVTMSGV